MTEVGLKEDNATNRAAWRNKISSYTGDPRCPDKPGKKKKNKIKPMYGLVHECDCPAAEVLVTLLPNRCFARFTWLSDASLCSCHCMLGVSSGLAQRRAGLSHEAAPRVHMVVSRTCGNRDSATVREMFGALVLPVNAATLLYIEPRFL